MIAASTRTAFLGIATLLGACSSRWDTAGAATHPVASSGPAPQPTPPVIEPPPPPPVAELSCAPCGKIVFTSARDGNDELYSVNADGTGLTRLTNDPASDDNAAWSPDGKRIAFTSRTGTTSVLVVMDEDGRNVFRHDLPQKNVWAATWWTNGTKITYSAASTDGSPGGLLQVDADGGYPALLFTASAWVDQASWSPDGTKLAFASDWLLADFFTDVFLIDPDGSGLTRLTDGNTDFIDYRWPSWSPDGARIATTMQQYLRLPSRAYIGVMNRDGSDLKPLIAAALDLRSSWSPDGTMIAFTAGSEGAYDVAWVKADGSAQGLIVADGRNPAWQP
jgi:Tol biopolymer transport system component